MKKKVFYGVLIAVTFLLVTYFAIRYNENFVMVVPLYISMSVMFLQSQVNRYTFLVGGINSVFYALVLFYTTLYSSAAFALFFSAPMQIWTFINWNKNSYGKATVFRRLNVKDALFAILSFIVIWIVAYLITAKGKSDYLLLDSLAFSIGVVNTVLTSLCFVEYAYFTPVGNMINIIIYSQMINERPVMMAYLVYSCYAVLCQLFGIYKTRKIYHKQQIIEDFQSLRK